MNVDPKNDTQNRSGKSKRRKKQRKTKSEGGIESDLFQNFRASGKTPFVLLKMRAETCQGPVVGKSLADEVAVSIQNMYGVVGGGILRYSWVRPHPASEDAVMHTDTDNARPSSHPLINLAEGESVIRAATQHFKRIWAALTMITSIDGTPVRISVIQTCDETTKTMDNESDVQETTDFGEE